jgi:hypothetical protein
MKSSARRRRAPLPVVEYPVGYFTAPIRRPSAKNPDGWPPRFTPQFHAEGRDLSAISSAARMAYVLATGNTGTIKGLGAATQLQGEAAKRKVSINATR